MNTLPTFRSLAYAAVAQHLSVAPYDGAALLLAKAAPATPLLDQEVLTLIQQAQASLDGARAALSALRHIPEVSERSDAAEVARRTYHRATMAYYGVEVAS